MTEKKHLVLNLHEIIDLINILFFILAQELKLIDEILINIKLLPSCKLFNNLKKLDDCIRIKRLNNVKLHRFLNLMLDKLNKLVLLSSYDLIVNLINKSSFNFIIEYYDDDMLNNFMLLLENSIRDMNNKLKNIILFNKIVANLCENSIFFYMEFLHIENNSLHIDKELDEDLDLIDILLEENYLEDNEFDNFTKKIQYALALGKNIINSDIVNKIINLLKIS